MPRTTFLLGIHNHQPVGNFGEVFEAGWKRSYAPFMEVMKRFPGIKWSLHLSGILWDFMKDKHPEYIADVKKMCDDGRLEILSGGYYEPILAVIPDRDKAAQLKKLRSFIKNTFGQNPRGIWLTERIWEPSLPKFLASEGIEYTLTDDFHFTAAGMNEDWLRGYYVTEDEGFKLNIFPISRKLRYYVPFDRVEKSMELFKAAGKYDSALTMGDDGEKFGMWPKTFEHVYGENGDCESGWLYRFFDAISADASWLDTNTFSGFLDTHAPSGRVYLPSTSYFEMSEWTLPPASQAELEKLIAAGDTDARIAAARRYLRGGFWRNFLTKYPESNNMHKKMLRVSERVAAAAAGSGKKKSLHQPAAADIEAAAEHLYAAQCNCAYWHGVFGGLYLPHLRKAVYDELIEAEKSLGREKTRLTAVDADKDGLDEIIAESKTQNLYISPARGGSLYEWDVLEPPSNALNVLTRRYEAYHEKLKTAAAMPPGQEVSSIHGIARMKEKNLDKYLCYDWHPRASLLDHFLSASVSFDEFARSRYTDLGDFTLEPYAARIERSAVVLRRDGKVEHPSGPLKTSVEKKISLLPRAAGIGARYKITNDSPLPAEYVFAVEFNAAFFAGFPSGRKEAADSWEVFDKVTGLTLRFDVSPSAEIWFFPVETVSLSEDGFERTLQGGCVLLRFPLRPAPGASALARVNAVWKK